MGTTRRALDYTPIPAIIRLAIVLFPSLCRRHLDQLA
jgi:hypothetical protein